MRRTCMHQSVAQASHRRLTAEMTREPSSMLERVFDSTHADATARTPADWVVPTVGVFQEKLNSRV